MSIDLLSECSLKADHMIVNIIRCCFLMFLFCILSIKSLQIIIKMDTISDIMNVNDTIL